MKIGKVTSRAFRLPLREKMVSSLITMTHRELVLVEIETTDGHKSTGWCTTAGVGIMAVKALIDSYLIPSLIGEDPRNNEKVWKKLWRECHPAGPSGLTTLALSAIDIALWDMKGKLAKEPLYRLLGGARTSVPVYASAINLHLTQDQLVAQIKGNIDDGYNAFKLKVGRSDLREDIARCRAVRELIGSNRQLMLDANQKWGVGEAAQRCQILSEVSPMFVEEPLLSDDVAGHRQLRLTGGIPVAMGEQLCNRYEFWNYVRGEAADFLQPDVWKVGGVTEWLKIAHMAETANIELSPHGSIEISAHLAAAVPNALHIENIFGLSLYEIGATKTPLPIVEGVLQLDDRPGHGIDWDGPNLGAEYEVLPGSAIKREALIHSGL